MRQYKQWDHCDQSEEVWEGPLAEKPKSVGLGEI